MRLDNLKKAIAHAFAVDDGSTAITDEDLALLDKLAGFIVRRKLVAPTILFLETFRPLNFVGSQMMTFFRPTLGIFLNQDEYTRLEQILEKRCSIRLFITRIEELDRAKKQ